MPVKFDGNCLEYILQFFDKARADFYGNPGRSSEQLPSASAANPLFHKQAIIVLREELEYFPIPPKSNPRVASTDGNGIPTKDLIALKHQCGDHLLGRKSIFTALQRNVNRENNVAEQHLIDMLCMRSVATTLSCAF
jgi:hypothetical protein